MAEYTIIGPEGERIIECPDGRCLHTVQMVTAELNRLAAENAELRELYGAAKEECARGRSKGSALDIGDTGKALWGAYHAAVRSHEAARHKHAEVIKERSR